MSIKISKNAHVCAACGLDFQHGQTLTSSVKKSEGVLHRQDFCQECWRAEQKKESYSVWNVIYHDPKVESEEPPEVFSPLRQLFYEAAEEDSRLEMAKAFLAAGLLRRQKVFRRIKESDEADGSVQVTLYTDRIGNRLIEVPDPQFSYAELEAARIKLLERLQELEAAVEEPVDPSPSGEHSATRVETETGHSSETAESAIQDRADSVDVSDQVEGEPIHAQA